MILCLFLLGTLPVLANDMEVGSQLEQPIMNVDENGNVTEYDPSDLEKELVEEPALFTLLPEERKNIEVGVVNFRVKSSAGENTLYTVESTGASGYVNGYAASDAAFLGYASNGNVRFKMSGVIGQVKPSEVKVVEYEQAKSVSFYKAMNGNLYHFVTNDIYSTDYISTIRVGKNPSFLQEGIPYYSYDGHYFYTSYAVMISDYKNNVYSNSVNANAPYYNYYQYLPHRSKTSFSAAQLDSLTASKAQGKLNNLGSSFIQYQEEFGTNAALVYSVAVLESGWGTSYIAKQKNNLFGHGAVDSNPLYGANGYKTPADSVYYHSKVFISEGYCDPLDYGGRYYGSHLGNKESGINVKYASDPYWGEKVASIAWQLEDTYHLGDDMAYTLAIKPAGTNLNIRKEISNSKILYRSGLCDAYPVLVLEKGDSWMRIQSDPTLTSDRSNIKQDDGRYNFDLDYGYIDSNQVYTIQEGTKPQAPSIMLGDVNLDGKITPSDYVKVKNHIMKKSELTGQSLQAADMNQDGKITPADYVKIKNTIMGK